MVTTTATTMIKVFFSYFIFCSIICLASEKRSVSEPGYGNDIDWIEAEIVIDDVIDQPRILPDGQVDIELD